MNNVNMGKAIAAGLAGTLVMTLIMVMAPIMGMPKMDIAAMLGSLLAGAPPAPGSSVWIVGFTMHLLIGSVVLPLGFALFSKHLPSSTPSVKGLVYGLIVWLVAQVMVMPMMGAGLFSSSLPRGAMTAMGSLMGHLIYGTVLGFMYGPQRQTKELSHLITLGL